MPHHNRSMSVSFTEKLLPCSQAHPDLRFLLKVSASTRQWPENSCQQLADDSIRHAGRSQLEVQTGSPISEACLERSICIPVEEITNRDFEILQSRTGGLFSVLKQDFFQNVKSCHISDFCNIIDNWVQMSPKSVSFLVFYSRT